MKRQIISLPTMAILLMLYGFSGQSACIHNSEAPNNGTCYADAVKNSNGTWTVNSYNCETPRPNGGYPPTHNCIIGEGVENEEGDVDQIDPGL